MCGLHWRGDVDFLACAPQPIREGDRASGGESYFRLQPLRGAHKKCSRTLSNASQLLILSEGLLVAFEITRLIGAFGERDSQIISNLREVVNLISRTVKALAADASGRLPERYSIVAFCCKYMADTVFQ